MYNKESESADVPIKKIRPSLLVSDEPSEMDDFFLVLALIYNDLKGLIHLEKDFIDNHELPATGEPRQHLGEYNGMTTQLYKTLAGLLNEFLKFLREHQVLFSAPKFQLLVLKLSPELRQRWNDVLDAALERSNVKNPDSIGYRLMRIRDNVAFHYYESEKVLRRAFKEFFANSSLPNAAHAYYSMGETMQETRFYYADAAAQRYLMDIAGGTGKPENFDEDVKRFHQFQQETFALVRSMNILLANLLKQFMDGKHNGRL